MWHTSRAKPTTALSFCATQKLTSSNVNSLAAAVRCVAGVFFSISAWSAGLVCFNAESWLDTGYNNTVHFQDFVAVCCLAQLPSHVRKSLRESGFLQWKHDSEKTRLSSTWLWQPLGYIMKTKCQRLRHSGQIFMTSVTTQGVFLFLKTATTPLRLFCKGG